MIVRSAKYLAGSRGAPCAFQIPGVCTGDAETTIPAHIRDDHTGRSVKASDLSVGDCCWACHEAFDGRAKMPDGFLITGPEWLHYALRALQRTQERRVDMGLLVVVGFDPQAIRTERRAKRKTKPSGRKIAGRGFPEQSRPLVSRNNLADRKERSGE